MAYSVVERKSLVEENPGVKQHATVKSSKGENWKCQIVFKGTKNACIRKQSKLENLLLDEQADEEEPPSKRRKETIDIENPDISKDESSDEDEEEEEDEEEKDMKKEIDRVKALMAKNTPKESNLKEEHQMVAIPEKLLKELFDGVYKRLDTISNLLQQQLPAAAKSPPSTPSEKPTTKVERIVSKQESSPQSPGGNSSFTIVAEDYDSEEYIWNGTNLLQHINAKAKKPKLYATALLSHLFKDKEMREGCVEPIDGGTKKTALDQRKIHLIKKCIKARYGEKLLERSWPEIRTSLNQKCLDKLKAFRKASVAEAEAAVETE